MNRTILALSGCSLLGLLLVACNKASDRTEFGPERSLTQSQRPTKFGASVDERLPTQMPGAVRSGMGDTAGGGGATFTAETPPGWTALPPRQFRDLNYQVAGNAEAECYLSAGIGGGLEGNFERWVGQFGMQPGSVKLGTPDQMLMGQPAFLVSLEGTFQKKPDQALLGLIADTGGGAIATLKMTGPRDVVKAQHDAFLKLAASIRSSGGAGTGSVGPAPGPDTGTVPPGHEQMMGGNGNAPAGTGELQAGTVPSGWKAGPGGGMRALDYRFGTTGECYIVVLGGQAGGVRGNVDRWCGEMGKPNLKPAELAALPTRPVLGTQGTFVEIRGSFSSRMSGKEIPDAILLGAIVPMQDRTVFVKMIGPASEVEAQRKAFADFCTGLKW